MNLKQLRNRLIEKIKSLRIPAQSLKASKQVHGQKQTFGSIIYSWMRHDAIRRIVLVMSVTVLVFSLFMIGSKLYGYYHDNKQYEQLQAEVSLKDRSNIFNETSSSPTPDSPAIQDDSDIKESSKPILPYLVINGSADELDIDGILSDYSKLKKQNTDLAGWIQMPGFKKEINYPVMYSKDTEYYLYKDFYKNYSYAGSVFMDFRNDTSMVDRHIIIYGHAMRDMSMFGNLREFPNKPDNYTTSTKIYFDLMNTRMEYEVFSTYIEHHSFNYRQVDFSTDDEYSGFLENIKNKSVYDYGVNLTPMDKIITLSTCNDAMNGNARSIIHARLIKQITYIPDANSAPSSNNMQSSDKKTISANVYLTGLSLCYESENKTVQSYLTPEFGITRKDYTAELPSYSQKVVLSFQTADPLAGIKVTLNGKVADPAQLVLEMGQNIIQIRITSRDGEYGRTYTIKANRAAPHDDDIPEAADSEIILPPLDSTPLETSEQ